MELRQFLAFKEVVERGGFTRAANHLHLTQSAVSQQVKALEDELGTALLHRVCRQVRLTDAGHVFLTHAKPAPESSFVPMVLFCYSMPLICTRRVILNIEAL